MPKKITKHVKTLGTTKKLRAGDSARSETVVEHSPSVCIGVQNTKRWVSLKKRMGFASDDDLAVHLLNLAETVVSETENPSLVETQKDRRDRENNAKEIASAPESSRRSSRKNLTAKINEVTEKKKRASGRATQSELNTSDQQNGRHKSKHHRSKTKHHKDKRKRKKHPKSIELESSTDNGAIPATTHSINNNHENIDSILSKSDENLLITRGTRDESVIQKTEKVDTVVLTTNVDSKENISENSQHNTDGINDEFSVQENSHLTKTLSSPCSVVKQIISNTIFEVINKDDSIASSTLESHQNEQSTTDCNSNAEDINPNEDLELDTKADSEEKKTKKKRKHTKSEVDSNNVEPPEINSLEDSLHKHRKKKHKQTVEHKNKKNHDVRKAPQDGMIPTEVCEPSEEAESISTTSNPSQAEYDAELGTYEPQRLAIKIKLCQNCNNRHIQGACPLISTVYEITDALTYEEWLNRHKNNPEVVKAISIEDPMAEGYGKVVDDVFESDEDSPDQYKSKSKAQNEEKRLLIDKERPLYARESLPDCLELKITNSDHGLGIFTKNSVPMYAKLGPLVGKPVKEMDIPDDFSMRHIWELDIDGKTSYISTTNPLQSNWVRYMRPAETKEDRSVAVITSNGELYFVTTQNITPGTELTYWADSPSFAWARKNKSDKTNCGGCNLTFAHSIYYRLHCCIFHDTNYSLTIRKYHCKVCGAAVLGKDNIMKHAAELHAGRGAYQCQYCRKFFLRLNYLEMHRTYGCAQNPQRSRPLCDFCGRKFCQPQKLKVHIKRMHSDMSEVLREFQCKLCLKLLGSRAALQRHMKEVHHKDVVAAATCDRCGKMFQNKSNLKIHMLTHSGVKPFKCKENNCKAAFTTKQCLQFHYKKVHGLTEEMMPKIERSVAYTFDAYSGGLLEENTSEKSLTSNPHDSQDQGNSMASIDDCSSEGSLKNDTSSNSAYSTQVDLQADMNLSPVKHSLNRESPRDQLLRQDIVHASLESSLSAVRQDHEVCAPSRLQSKGSKKWMGEFNPPSTKTLEHSHSVTPSDVYEFEDVIKKGEGRISPLPSASLIDDSKLSLSVYRRTESANASLLVEAALDAAERDIGTVSSPMLDDNDRDGNLYSISSHLQSPLPPRSPEHHLDSYIQQQEDLMSPVPTPDNRNSSPSHVHTDYHLHRSIDYVNATRTHNIEQYLHHDELQRISPSSSYIHMTQGDLNSLSATPTTRYSDHHHHHHPHHHQHQVSPENLSSDEGDSVAQNLSLSVKEKSLQLDLSTSYKYDSLDLEFGNRERSNFEPLMLNNGELQGLDMSARGFHNFASQIQNSRYHHHHHHHHLYDITERQSVDLSRTGAYSISPPPPPPYPPHSDVLRVVSLDLTPGGRHSVDLSLSRSHHLHGNSSRIITSPRPPNSTTPHIVPDVGEGRILSSSSPPPPPLPGYNPAYPVSPASYHPPRPGYHYSGYY